MTHESASTTTASPLNCRPGFYLPPDKPLPRVSQGEPGLSLLTEALTLLSSHPPHSTAQGWAPHRPGSPSRELAGQKVSPLPSPCSQTLWPPPPPPPRILFAAQRAWVRGSQQSLLQALPVTWRDSPPPAFQVPDPPSKHSVSVLPPPRMDPAAVCSLKPSRASAASRSEPALLLGSRTSHCSTPPHPRLGASFPALTTPFQASAPLHGLCPKAYPGVRLRPPGTMFVRMPRPTWCMPSSGRSGISETDFPLCSHHTLQVHLLVYLTQYNIYCLPFLPCRLPE